MANEIAASKQESLKLILIALLFNGQFTACSDFDFLHRSVSIASLDLFNVVHYIKAVQNFAKDDMGTIQPGSHHSGDKKSRTVCVLTSVGHGQSVRSVMLQLEVLILKLAAVNRFSTISFSCFKVATLKHEVGDHPVENRVFVAKGRVIRNSQLSKVLNGLWHNGTKQTNGDTSNFLAIFFNVEIHLVSNRWVFRQTGGASCNKLEKRKKRSKNCKDGKRFHHVSLSRRMFVEMCGEIWAHLDALRSRAPNILSELHTDEISFIVSLK
ncbi:hypothetical protein CLUG_03599 [Clavispora lusitaniae ATCC 42720]|uniref:Uncharacterized protein n=1 Tax=Clavispora lusitaniae (strain ATCC 42720) TaxID=306902 RepID=C4Y615_CLAL4|nr:uncharacterized protein CLUG_03599 [Clavispora lusitaniae ATCC 42720]EEQ39471.1 hypothetical protein CLUG_03599 [Clavispora lusitaniae ATCC 42720]